MLLLNVCMLNKFKGGCVDYEKFKKNFDSSVNNCFCGCGVDIIEWSICDI